MIRAGVINVTLQFNHNNEKQRIQSTETIHVDQRMPWECREASRLDLDFWHYCCYGNQTCLGTPIQRPTGLGSPHRQITGIPDNPLRPVLLPHSYLRCRALFGELHPKNHRARNVYNPRIAKAHRPPVRPPEGRYGQRMKRMGKWVSHYLA